MGNMNGPRSFSLDQLSSKKIDTTMNREEKVILEESEELGASALQDKKISLKIDGPFKHYYNSRYKTPNEIDKLVVTRETKRMLLEKMLQDVDRSIAQVMLVLKNAESGAILGRKNVQQFCGPTVVGDEAPVYQKIVFATDKHQIEPVEIARMSMVEYLKKYLGYDLAKDKQRSVLLQKFTNAFS